MDEVLDPQAGSDETDVEAGVRPTRLSDFVGQSDLRAQLELVLGGAAAQERAADHMLFSGPPGLGKTTLAGIVAAELGSDLRATSGPALERPGDLAAILTHLEPSDVLFLDEVHRLPRAVEEVLYPAMEDGHLDIVVGKGPGARAIRMSLPPFTLVGATTRAGLLTSPLRDRFGFTARLAYYETEELTRIVVRTAEVSGASIDADGAAEIARRGRGTPRVANRLLRRVRDYADVRADGRITASVAAAALEVFEVDDRGLDRLDRAVCDALCRGFAGRAVGLSTLAVAVGEEPETLETVVEPYLIREGLLARTPRGRAPTPATYAHLGLAVPEVGAADDAATPHLPFGSETEPGESNTRC